MNVLSRRLLKRLKLSTAIFPKFFANSKLYNKVTIPQRFLHRSSIPLVVSSKSNHMMSAEDILKPVSDKRAYRHIKLENGMEAFLLSDPDCDRAACSLNVGVGSIQDPSELSGLAHFLEHMLFLGTKKYPEEDDYNRFLQQHGGSSNAFTCDLHTCYYFDVSPDHLDGAVDRFNQFFLAPLFTASATCRELDAVHSEHTKNILSDERRDFQLLKFLSNPNHPFNHFSTGNHKTLRDEPARLGIDTRQALLNFHSKYYSSNIMRLAILGKQSLDELQAMICNDRFNLLDNKNVQVPKGNDIGGAEVAFRQQDLMKYIKIIPVKDMRSFRITWVMPEQTDLWRTKPTRYISHLMGHEGKGSLLSALKSEGLATQLAAGVTMDLAGMSLFQCTIELTEEGLESLDKVFGIVSEYIRLLKKSPVQSWVVEELKMLSNIEFEFLSQPSPADHVVSVTHGMHYYPPKEVLAGPHMIWESDEQELKEMISYLTTDRANVTLLAKKLEQERLLALDQWKEEEYYGIKYCVEDLPLKWRDESASSVVSENLKFPEPNPFLPKDLKIKPRSNTLLPDTPKELKNLEIPNVNVRAFFKQDKNFDLPKAMFLARMSSPYIGNSLRSLCVSDLYIFTLGQLIKEYAYDAEVAGLNYELCLTVNMAIAGDCSAYDLQLGGFNDALPVLLKALSQNLKSPVLNETSFDVAKDILIRGLKKMTKNLQPYQQALRLKCQTVQVPYYTAAERLAVVNEISFEDVKSLAKEQSLLKNLTGEILMQGNMLESEARANIAAMFQELQPVKESIDMKIPTTKVADLSTVTERPSLVRFKMSETAVNQDELNNASLLMIQMGLPNSKEAALTNLALKYLHQPFFDSIRTKQQLGYIVTSIISKSAHVDELCFVVQSAWATPSEITSRIESFLEHFIEGVDNHLDEVEFDKLRAATISQLTEKPKRLEDEASRNFKEICWRRFDFSRKERQAEILKDTSFEEFKQFVKSINSKPWLALEISSVHPPQDAPNECVDDEDITSRHPPIKPKVPVQWETIDNPNVFLESRVRDFFMFPLPGKEQLIEF